MVYCGLTWERYLAIDQALGGEDRGGPRLFYLDGQLEFVNASAKHEWWKALVSFFLE